MAAEAVFLNHLFAGLPDIDSLRFVAQREDRGVAQTVGGLEVIFSYEAVMRHMALVAVSDGTVGTVRPGGKLWRHYVAVDADPGVIGEI